jgi:hypothetical protein
MTPSRQFRYAALALMVAYGALVASHGGEFWPFSIFPMFAKAGRVWSRAIVRDVGADFSGVRWSELEPHELPGRPFPLDAVSIDQNDLSALVSPPGDRLDGARLGMLDRWFQEVRGDRHLVIYAAHGWFDGDGLVRVRYRPVALVGPSGVLGAQEASR